MGGGKASQVQQYLGALTKEDLTEKLFLNIKKNLQDMAVKIHAQDRIGNAELQKVAQRRSFI